MQAMYSMPLFCVQDDGVTFVGDGKEIVFRGTVTIVSADNLAAQVLGGYKALSAAFRKCRTCMTIDEDMQTKVTIL